jgi:hypothetical protein
MLVITRCRIFCLPVYYPEMYRLRYAELQLEGRIEEEITNRIT